jgi:Xaa-Pro aminopeptidase
MEAFEERIARIRQVMTENNLDLMMVSVEENRRYLSGFTGEDHQFDESAGALLISMDRLILATDSRFELQARNESPGFETIIYRKGLAKKLPGLAASLNSRRLGFESVRISVKQYDEFKKELESANTNLEMIPTQDLVENMRLIKSEDEIEKTRKALHLAEKVFCSIVKTITPGMTEKQIAWEMEKGMREAGADMLSFPVIVAAGPNSALPHAIPTDRPIRTGEPILFDWGARLDGYCSDISRTIIIGSPDETFLKVHQTVLEAQQRAIAAITDGANSKYVDSLAREYIRQQGFEGKFGHGLGHGTGLAVHEGPRLSPLKEMELQAGMIVTVEPGIYLPEWGGVRIENQVVVGENGPRVLNRMNTTYEINQINCV